MDFHIGDLVKIKYDNSVGAIIDVTEKYGNKQYTVLVNQSKLIVFPEQISALNNLEENITINADELNSLLTSRLLTNPNLDSLYSLNSAKIDYIPYQFRPVLKIIKSDSPRILIADGVGVGKTIEAGLVLKELEARFNIESVLVICPKPLISENKWKNELKTKFGESFRHIDGKTLKYCIEECYLDDEWPEEYKKCIIPYSLFDEAIVDGTKDHGMAQPNKKSLASLKLFPKFDLVIIDEAHHIKNPNTYAYKAVKKFCDNAESIVMLTATPIQLGDKDLFVLLNLIRPDMVFDYNVFQTVCEPNPYINEASKIVRGCDENWQEKALETLELTQTTKFGKLVLKDNPTYKKIVDVLAQDTIKKEERVKLISDIESLHTLNNIINRTRRRDIGNFTIRKPETLKVQFTHDQQILYDNLIEIQKNILINIHGDHGIRFMMTTIMRQASSCIQGLKPFLEDILTRKFDELGFNNGDYGEYPDDDIDIASVPEIYNAVKEILSFANVMSDEDYKLDKLIETVKAKQQMKNNKVMVFSSFRHTLNYLSKNLTDAGIRTGVIHGGISDDERLKLRDRFKSDRDRDDSIDVLLFSEVGCEGLDYQFCDCMVNYDLPWNPQKIEQRIGRIDRNGQKSESISIINLITEGTIDCDIYERCLLRIGVFNSAIGDSEEILGTVTKEIYNIVESYILNSEDIKEKEMQIADNAIRKMQEQQKLEDERHSFFGFDVSQSIMKEEMENAKNIHLSSDAIKKLVSLYLTKILGAENEYILGNGQEKSLRLNAENRKKLLSEFYKLGRQPNPIYRAWEKYLINDEAYEKITFDGNYSAENHDVEYIMPAHPLVKQAIKYFDYDTAYCSLRAVSDKIPEGDYPFAIFEWQYKGIKTDNKIKVVTNEKFDSRKLLEIIYTAQDYNQMISKNDMDKLEEITFNLWNEAKSEYIKESKFDIDAKLNSLKWSQDAQLNLIEKRLQTENDVRIIKMKNAQIERLKNDFNKKQMDLKLKIEQCDIIVNKLAAGILHIEG